MQFLDLAVYYHKFILGFSSILQGHYYNWRRRRRVIFGPMTILRYPDFGKEFVLQISWHWDVFVTT
jgi:hypothetical protein